MTLSTMHPLALRRSARSRSRPLRSGGRRTDVPQCADVPMSRGGSRPRRAISVETVPPEAGDRFVYHVWWSPRSGAVYGRPRGAGLTCTLLLLSSRIGWWGRG